MRLLFIKQSLTWPRSSGHDVHAFHMMQACTQLGATVSLATVRPPVPEALAGLPLAHQITLDVRDPATIPSRAIPLTRMQEKFRSYYGVPMDRIREVAFAAAEVDAEAVVAVGLEALPYLSGDLGSRVRAWYAADEWVLHHLSLLKLGDPDLKTHLRSALVKGVYERVYAPRVDRAWVVSSAERRAMRWFAGVRHADVVPNGVDGTFFQPIAGEPAPRSAVFWGRLDFEPNIQGIQWFCDRIWPDVRRQVPDATFTIVGFQASEAVKKAAAAPGIRLIENLPDLRDEVGSHAAVVLPFVSGGGIKNKLLEAAAMGKAIVCTPRVMSGLKGEPPLVQAKTPAEWSAALVDLWNNDSRRRQLGTAARAWVLEHHTWTAAARDAIAGLEASRAERAAW
jgi:glycosyltransferase involved in cell wall biosynthesis